MLYYLPYMLIGLPLVFSIVAYISGKVHCRIRNGVVVAVSLVSVLGVMVLAKQVAGGRTYNAEWRGVLVSVDETAVIMALITSVLWLMASVYSLKYMEGKSNLNRYYSALMLTFAGCMGVAFSRGIIEFLVFFEIASLVPYVLIIHSHSPQAHKAASKYLYMCVIGGFLVFYGTVVTFWVKGTGDFLAISSSKARIPASALIAYLTGFGIKGGLVPLHTWLPDAHSVAPSPVSSLLSGVTVKVGMLGIIKLVYYICPGYFAKGSVWNEVLLVTSFVSIIMGSLLAIGQKKVKRMLAYSTISQMGYILLGIGLMSYWGLAGALYHFFSHSLMKGSLFLIAGAVKHRKGVIDLDDFRGLGKEMPVTMLCYSVSALSMVGMPLFSGFMTKWYIGLGTLDGGRPFYLVVLIVSSLLNLVYFLPPAINAFFPKEDTYKRVRSPNPLMLMPIVLLGLGVIYGGIFHNFVLRLALAAAERVLSP